MMFCHTLSKLISNAFLLSFFTNITLAHETHLRVGRRKLPFDDKLSPLTFGHGDQHVKAKYITLCIRCKLINLKCF